MNLRGLWRSITRRRTTVAPLIACAHSGTRTACQLRRRPGDLRKSCWEVCHNCGTWLACNC